MKLIKNYVPTPITITSQELEIGEMMEVTEPNCSYTSNVILRIYTGFVNLNKPVMTWGNYLIRKGRRLNPGESVTLIQE